MTMVATRVDEISKFLKPKGFVNIESYKNIGEIFVCIFVKEEIKKQIFSLKSDSIKQGKIMGIATGNKGCCAYSFALRDRIFNFIGLHLKHGAENAEVRNQKMAEIIRDVNLQYEVYQDLDCDVFSEFTYVLGDMNYRINSTYD